MLYVTFFDVQDLTRGRDGDDSAAVRFAPNSSVPARVAPDSTQP
jgi:hypothetical protein